MYITLNSEVYMSFYILLLFCSEGSEKLEFIDAYHKPEGETKKRRGSRSGSKSGDVNPELVKTAVYVKHIFMVSTHYIIAMSS